MRAIRVAEPPLCRHLGLGRGIFKSTNGGDDEYATTRLIGMDIEALAIAL